MGERLIKSKKRVQKHGEVFTPSWMVQKMLDSPGIKDSCEDIYATFLEPAAGDGNFLQAILERKLFSVTKQFNKRMYKTKSLFALSSIYGIEILKDNLDIARSRMFLFYLDWYEKTLSEKLSSNSEIYKSALFIINKNVVHGNTLSKINPITGEPIQFYQWEKITGEESKVRYIPFLFADLFGDSDGVDRTLRQQISFFDVIDDFTKTESTNEKLRNEIDIKKVYTLER